MSGAECSPPYTGYPEPVVHDRLDVRAFTQQVHLVAVQVEETAHNRSYGARSHYQETQDTHLRSPFIVTGNHNAGAGQ